MNSLLGRAAVMVTAFALVGGIYCLQPERPLEHSARPAMSEIVLASYDDTPLFPDLTGTNVVSAVASLSENSEGGFDVRVAVRIAPGWHISTMNQGSADGISAPTTLASALPQGLEQVGAWSVPDPELNASGAGPVTRVYTGDIRFSCRLKQTAVTLADPSPIHCRLGYQACNRFTCKPFETVTLSASLEETHPNHQE